MSVDQKLVKIFSHISDFVKELSDIFGSKQHSLLLYARLIDVTNNNHASAIEKHVHIFDTFVHKNYKAILEKKVDLLSESTILYSKKANIKLSEIFKLADSNETAAIWKHLLVILTAIDPSAEAMKELKKTFDEKTKEGEFLNGLVEKIESNLDPNSSDPMTAIMGLMGNGVFTDLISSMSSGMQSGNLDMSKLFGTVQTMLTTMGGNNSSSSSSTTVTTVETPDAKIQEITTLTETKKND